VGLEGVVVAPEREALEVAARLANAHDFIMALPHGYDTPLTNTSLSGGQRQRLCIARALLRSSAPILLLDEASSALDTSSEKLVQASIDTLISSSSSKRTTVTIAHRLSTIDGADFVCVMSSGSIIERGSPKELMGKVGGVFKAMREAQVLTPTTHPPLQLHLLCPLRSPPYLLVFEPIKWGAKAKTVYRQGTDEGCPSSPFGRGH
jgi:ABC-type multidrug transport system fused ATPase/permease subunit